MVTRERALRAVTLLLMALFVHCSGPPDQATLPEVELPARSAQEAAVALFQFASNLEQESTVPDQLVRADLLDQHRTSFLDGLDPLAGVPVPEIVGVEPFPDGQVVAIDAVFRLPGERLESWSVQVERQPDESWQVVWVQGPDVGWPPRKKGRDQGLSSSPPARQ